MTIQDQIGIKIQELVKCEEQILALGSIILQEAFQPELISRQLHELRAQRLQLRSELATLKQQHRSELFERLVEINKQIDDAHHNRKEHEDLRALSREVEEKIVAIDKELETLQP